MELRPQNRFPKRYLLGEFLFEPEKRVITRDGESIHLPNKPFQVLLYLIENRDRVVTRWELLDAFWDGKDVYDDTLRKSVGAIRRALKDQSKSPRFIETRHGEGYRFVGPLEEEIIEYAPSAVEIERIRGVRIVLEEEDSEAPDPSGQLAPSRLTGTVAGPTRKRLSSVPRRVKCL